MKFTLVQSEIEQAIQDYIGKVITVKEGATVTVDLRNTRGTDGITAEVDVSLSPLTGVQQPAQVAVPAATAQVKREAAPAPAAAKPAPVSAPEAVAPAEPVTPVAETIGQPPVTEPEEPTIPDEDDVPLVEPEQEEEPAAPATAGKSIFG